MYKRIAIVICVLFLAGTLPLSHAGSYVIKGYTFTWHVISIGSAKMEIQKTPKGLQVILGSLGGVLATLSLAPSQAKAIGEVLKKTEDYYEEQSKSDDRKSDDTIEADKCKVTFSSKQGRDFQIAIREAKIFSPEVLLSRSEAVVIGQYLRKAEKMAAFMDKRIQP